MDYDALGFIEITGVVAAIDALDIMTKAANVKFVSWERKLGGRLVTIIITGDVSSVTTAVESAVKLAIKKPAAKLILASPHSETKRIVSFSASRFEGKNIKDKKEDYYLSEV